NTQAFRAHEMITDMMLFARPPQPKLATCNLTAIISGVVAELRPAAQVQDTELAFSAGEEPITVSADKTQLAVAVRALCVNALEALGGGGRVEVAVSSDRTSSGAPAQTDSSEQSAQITV